MKGVKNIKIFNEKRRKIAKEREYTNIFIYKIIWIVFFILVVSIVIFGNYYGGLFKSELRIHFIDVGQGDACFIETPYNKTILIDGGGSTSSEFDLGKKTLIPYILDRGYTKIDYIIISHFDTDHVGGILSVLEELNVGQVIISNQGEDSENYKEFRKIIKVKKINVSIVNKGDRIKIERDLFFDILWPDSSQLLNENILNNNSIVLKLDYKTFSMLFTGDIEEIAEKQILEEYKRNTDILNSTILKAAHHGSKTSSIQTFIDKVKPKIVLIGVGENNKFGHPSEEVIKRFESYRCKIYRTDKMGEISIIINNKGMIKKITKMLEN